VRFLWAVAWRNLWRHGRRSLITAAAMAVGMAICMAMIALSDGMYVQMFDVLVRQQLGHVQVTHPDYPAKRSMYDAVPQAGAVVERIAALPDVVAVSGRLVGFGLVGGASTSAGAQLIGVDPAREASVGPIADRVRTGAWLSAPGAAEIVLGDGLAEELGATIGGEVVVVTQASDGSLGNALYTVVGFVHTGSSAVDDAGAYVGLADLQALLVLDDQIHEALVIGASDDDAHIQSVAAAVRAVAPDALVRTWAEASPPTAQMIQMQDGSAWIFLSIVFTVAAFGVLNTMMMSVFERTRELGVLRALGMRPWRLVVLVLMESVMLAGLAVAIGLAAGGALDAYLVTTGIDFSGSLEDGFEFSGVVFDPVVKGVVRVERIVQASLAVVLVAVGAGVWPAWRASRQDPVASLRAD
jgi:ABC-type lipoprotein release transport system permease subunit